ncbi:hypothetical protein BD626DRAFT_573367 [Schizophyllum amplum]|uniref:EH domain-containing protein n=1 Tax=Schizophyllum amplum TaxID=97359 RepID=A0A550C1A8_9AGAR|nr:hypothetical protein BD626DRAFT_573367 [Auriculariopsis ampla]
MPSTSLQSRISAFENISKSPPNGHSRKEPSGVDSPHEPSFSGSLATPVASPPLQRSRSGSPPTIVKKTSLIDLKDWVVDDGHSPPRDPPPLKSYKVYESKKTPQPGLLINLESPTKTPNGKAPPLPPRKPSYTSLRSVSSAASTPTHTYPPGKLDVPQKTAGHAPASSISSFHSVSLSEDTDPSSASPSSSSQFIATYPIDLERTSEADSASLGGESFEDVSSASYGSPTSAALIARDWDRARAMQKSAPPKLPQRPTAAANAAAAAVAAASASTPRLPSLKMPPPPPVRLSHSQSPATSSPSSPYLIHSPASSSTMITPTARRAPPVPPSRSSTSDRSSILSTTTSQSATSNSTHNPRSKLALSRPTPVPPAARSRYEKLFNGNVVQSRKAAQKKPALLSPSAARKTRQAAGWRGLSVDLIVGDESHPLNEDDIQVDAAVTGEDRLDGRVVRLVWQRSRLEKHKLVEIWNECDTAQKGSLDRDAFVRGMWRIDEELRRAQLRSSTLSSGSRLRAPPPPPRPKPKLILS